MSSLCECDVLIVGGGHAGCEAAVAAARMGANTVLLTMDPERLGQMSCNPAIGGLAKGQLVREIDALGGVMARVTDRTGMQFRMLNKGKGPAVWSPRAQVDREGYREEMTRVVEKQPGVQVVRGSAVEVTARGGRATGVRTDQGQSIQARALILATGTFLNGLMHVGFQAEEGGRHGEEASSGLTSSLERLGHRCGRLKTGTSPRIRADTVDFSVLTPQMGDEPPRPFSHFTKRLFVEQVPCHLTRTTAETSRLIRENLDRSPLYGGRIQGVGPRYCPSIEDKITRFPERESHQIIVEPEGRSSDLVYLNGLSTSLPLDVQVAMVHSIKGLTEAEIAVPGYAVEYDFVFPTQLEPSLQSKHCKGLFLAGQINGTSGYEEAAAQGFMAAVNAVRSLTGRKPMVLGRHEAYIGVLIDDLVTKGTSEPYRMFTSRAEYRLLLRQDNADERLAHYGRELGLLSEEEFSSVRERLEAVQQEISRLGRVRAQHLLGGTSGGDSTAASGEAGGLPGGGPAGDKGFTRLSAPAAAGSPKAGPGVAPAGFPRRQGMPLHRPGSPTERGTVQREKAADAPDQAVGGEAGHRSPKRVSVGAPPTLSELLTRPHVTYDDLARVDGDSASVADWLKELVEIRLKYAGYIKRQERDIDRFKRLESTRIPCALWEQDLVGLSLEANEKLKALAPRSLGQAGRIPGVTPADVSVLHLHLARFLRRRGAKGRGRSGAGQRG